MNVLLSIKPKYADAIINGDKLFEFRRKIFKNKSVDRVYLYATSPISKVVCSFEISRILENDPAALWNEVKAFSGISYEEFSEYFKSSNIGYAIEIKGLRVFHNPIDPEDLIEGFTPPRSFRYIDGQFAHVDYL